MTLARIRLIAVLAVSQIFGWGTTFDLPGILGRVLAADLGMANELAFAGLSVMMLTSAVIGPMTGRLIGRQGASAVLCLGSLAFALGLGLMAVATGPIVYFAAWVTLGIGGAFGLSVPAYAAVVEREGADAKRTIGLLMIFTGLSAAICWPIWSLLDGLFGWRIALAIAALFQVAVLLPLHRFGLKAPGATTAADRAATDREPLQLGPGEAKLAIVLIGVVSVLFNLVTTGIAPSLIELLKRSGATPELALTLGSLRSVLGISARAVDMLSGRRSSALTSGIIAAGLILVSMPILAFAGGATGWLALFIACYGFGAGISALARALLPLGFFSAGRYAAISATLSLPSNLAMAAGPVITTAILDRGGMELMIVYSAGIAALALAGLAGLALLARQGRVADTGQ